MAKIGVKQRHGDGKFEARAVVSGRTVHVGTYEDEDDAALARDLYILANHPDPAICRLNNPYLKIAKKLPPMPEPVGTILKGELRDPLSETGERYITKEGNWFIFRKSKVVKGKRDFTRIKCSTMAEAKRVRRQHLGEGNGV